MSTLVRIWKMVGHEGDADDALIAANAITTSTLDLAERILAIELVFRWIDEWKEATRHPMGRAKQPSPLKYSQLCSRQLLNPI